ncbi:SPOC like C-terminal domain-containing protein [Entophlyctis helioformis]|nr:SPOC like C-terminal domain-containing protein [Entophlyctis helioformis]
MHKTPLGSSMSAFRVAMSSIAGFMRSKILQNDSDTVGVLLYNTRDKKNSIDAAAVHVLFELDTPDVHRILKIESFASEESTFGTEIGSARQQCAFNEVFWIASTMFAKGAPRLARKRLFLITNNDNPVCLRDNPAIEDKMQLVATRTRLQDLRNVHVEVDVFAIDKSRTERFDFGRFYFKVANLILDAGPDIKAIPAEENFKELHSRVQLKEFRKRTAFRVPFCFGNDLEIGIKAYYVLMEAKKPTPVKLDSRTNREVESQTSLVCSVTGQMLLPADLKYYYELGGTKAVFTKDEVAAIKTFGTPGMLLFGFQDVSDLKPKHNLKPSLFVVPDESQYIGSSSLFAHLHKRMLDRKKMAICRLISRKGTAPRMVALVPQAAGIDPFGYAQHYGFNMIVLPFGDDIRSSTFTGDAAPSGLLDSFNQILRQVLDADHPFQLHDVPNPVIEKHQATLEALALGRDVIQEPVDRTLPNDEEIHNQVGELLLQFQAMCDDGVASPVATAAPAAGRRARVC